MWPLGQNMFDTPALYGKVLSPLPFTKCFELPYCAKIGHINGTAVLLRIVFTIWILMH